MPRACDFNNRSTAVIHIRNKDGETVQRVANDRAGGGKFFRCVQTIRACVVMVEALRRVTATEVQQIIKVGIAVAITWGFVGSKDRQASHCHSRRAHNRNLGGGAGERWALWEAVRNLIRLQISWADLYKFKVRNVIAVHGDACPVTVNAQLRRNIRAVFSSSGDG